MAAQPPSLICRCASALVHTWASLPPPPPLLAFPSSPPHPSLPSLSSFLLRRLLFAMGASSPHRCCTTKQEVKNQWCARSDGCAFPIFRTRGQRAVRLAQSRESSLAACSCSPSPLCRWCACNTGTLSRALPPPPSNDHRRHPTTRSTPPTTTRTTNALLGAGPHSSVRRISRAQPREKKEGQ